MTYLQVDLGSASGAHMVRGKLMWYGCHTDDVPVNGSVLVFEESLANIYKKAIKQLGLSKKPKKLKSNIARQLGLTLDKKLA